MADRRNKFRGRGRPDRLSSRTAPRARQTRVGRAIRIPKLAPRRSYAQEPSVAALADRQAHVVLVASS